MHPDGLSGALARERAAELHRQADAARLALTARSRRRRIRRRRHGGRDNPALAGGRQPLLHAQEQA